MARKYALHATLNAGAFSLNDNPELWKIFQKNILLASKKGRIFLADASLSTYSQISFLLLFYKMYGSSFVDSSAFSLPRELASIIWLNVITLADILEETFLGIRHYNSFKPVLVKTLSSSSDPASKWSFNVSLKVDFY